jgi:hypothetical protein
MKMFVIVVVQPADYDQVHEGKSPSPELIALYSRRVEHSSHMQGDANQKWSESKQIAVKYGIFCLHHALVKKSRNKNDMASDSGSFGKSTPSGVGNSSQHTHQSECIICVSSCERTLCVSLVSVPSRQKHVSGFVCFMLEFPSMLHVGVSMSHSPEKSLY